MSFDVALNRFAASLAPQASAEAQHGLEGLIKLFIRFGYGRAATSGDASLYLTAAQQRFIFTGGLRFLVKWGGRVFLAAAVLDFAKNIFVPDPERKSLTTRLEIIQAHIVKGGSAWSTAIGVAEQVLFIVLDSTGANVGDVLAGVFAGVDDPRTIPASLGNFSQRGYYDELLSPVEDFSRVDTIIEAPGIILRPGLTDSPAGSPITYPDGPRPSFGRRS